MTPKEKAKELFDKHCYAIRVRETATGYFTNIVTAKECALITVDEIIKITCLHHLDYKEYKNLNTEFTNYWQEVKEELNKM